MEIAITISAGILMFCLFYMLIYRLGIKKVLVEKRIEKHILKSPESTKTNVKEKKKQNKKVGFGEKLSAELDAAGVKLRADEYLMIWTATAIGPPLIFYLAGGHLISVTAVLLIGIIIPPMLVSRSKKQRMKLFEKQLADSIILISNSLKAGFAFQQAMESVSQEMPDPISGEFKRTLLEIQLGAPTDEAMGRMVKRTKSKDLSLMVSAILIQWKAGGNLSDVLDNISETIRDRLRIKGQIRVLTSSGRSSGFIIGLLPILLVAFLMIINPVYITDFISTLMGRIMLVVAVLMEILGFLLIKKIIDIKM